MTTILISKQRLKAGLTTVLFSFMLSAMASELTRIQSMDDLRWRHRVVIVNTADPQAQSVDALSADQAEIDDRDIIWFVINDTHVTSNFNGSLSARFERWLINAYSPENAGVFLIGKDGGVKQRYNELALGAVYQSIDAMPMRQREMRE